MAGDSAKAVGLQGVVGEEAGHVSGAKERWRKPTPLAGWAEQDRACDRWKTTFGFATGTTQLGVRVKVSDRVCAAE